VEKETKKISVVKKFNESSFITLEKETILEIQKRDKIIYKNAKKKLSTLFKPSLSKREIDEMCIIDHDFVII